MKMIPFQKLRGSEIDYKTVGYIDLLGVSRMVLEKPLEKVASIYVCVNLFEEASHLYAGGEEKSGKANPLKYIQFSDSSLFIGGAETAVDVRMNVYIISGLMTTLLLNEGIVSRGAIAFCDFATNEELKIYAGRPLIEAVKIESLTNWAGLTLVMPPDEKNELMEELHKYNWLSREEVPLKANAEKELSKIGITPERLTAVKWFQAANSKIDKLIEKIRERKNDTDDEAAKEKLENSIRFIKISSKKFE